MSFILYQNAKICYKKWGNGQDTVICLHGFGENSDSFNFLIPQKQDMTMIAPDLPLHGITQWDNTNTISIKTIYEIIEQLLLKENRTDQKITLLGFSMGGRIALHLTEAYPERIKKLVLIAPDGLKMNFWYAVATQTLLGNRFFKWVMEHPNPFIKLMKVMDKNNWINKGVAKFSLQFLQEKKVRQQLYTIWTGYRKIKPNLPAIKDHIKEHQIPVTLLYGKYDKIISYKTGEKFVKDIDSNYCTLLVINDGHQILTAKNSSLILSLLV